MQQLSYDCVNLIIIFSRFTNIWKWDSHNLKEMMYIYNIWHEVHSWVFCQVKKLMNFLPKKKGQSSMKVDGSFPHTITSPLLLLLLLL